MIIINMPKRTARRGSARRNARRSVKSNRQSSRLRGGGGPLQNISGLAVSVDVNECTCPAPFDTANHIKMNRHREYLDQYGNVLNKIECHYSPFDPYFKIRETKILNHIKYDCKTKEFDCSHQFDRKRGIPDIFYDEEVVKLCGMPT